MLIVVIVYAFLMCASTLGTALVFAKLYYKSTIDTSYTYVRITILYTVNEEKYIWLKFIVRDTVFNIQKIHPFYIFKYIHNLHLSYINYTSYI
jgi:hypothetical protein